MRELPILFSSEMIRAILDGQKTQTRRVVPETTIDPYYEYETQCNAVQGAEMEREFKNEKQYLMGKSKYGILDHLYVRETYYQKGHWEEVPGVKTKGGRMKWAFIPADDEILFEAPEEYRKGRHHKDPYTIHWHKRLARFMPRKAARIWLEVTNVRVERLQDISEEDAKAEGANKMALDDLGNSFFTYKRGFETLWTSVYSRESWEANPWVFVYTFKILSTTGKP